jgi:DNA-directed RNA polymerase subunit M
LSKAKFCPKCGSTNVFYASGLPQLWSLWDCRNCGYRGALILEDGDLAEKLRKEWRKKKASRDAAKN